MRRDRSHPLFFVVVLIVVFAAIGSCDYGENEDLPFAPTGCVRQEPSTGALELLVTITQEFPSVPVTIYRGNIEDRIVLVQDTLTQISKFYSLLTEVHYSAVALYVIGADTVAVLDSDKIETILTQYRDRDCWEVRNGLADLQLRVRP